MPPAKENSPTENLMSRSGLVDSSNASNLFMSEQSSFGLVNYVNYLLVAEELERERQMRKKAEDEIKLRRSEEERRRRHQDRNNDIMSVANRLMTWCSKPSNN